MNCSTSVDTHDITSVLLARAESLRHLVESKIPGRFRGILCAEDVLQEVWIAAFQTRPGEIRDVDRWLTTVTHSKLVDALRMVRALKRGGGQRPLVSAAQRRSSFEDLFSRVCASQKTPSREISAQEARHAVQVALSMLPEDRRQAVHLRHIEGHSRKEIAGIMQTTEGAVNSLLYRGLNELRVRMGDAARYFSGARTAGTPQRSP